MGLFRKKKKRNLDEVLAEADASPKPVKDETIRLFKAFWLSLMPFQRCAFESLMKRQCTGDFDADDAKNTAIEAEVIEDEEDD